MKKNLLILAGLLYTFISWADTATNVKYIDANGTEQTCSEATVVESSSDQVTWAAGWYVVQGTDITLDKTVKCTGDVHLILADGAKLTVSDNQEENPDDYDDYRACISVGEGNTFQIYGQTSNTGTLIATNTHQGAGIGGPSKAIIINGGTIQVQGNGGGAGIGCCCAISCGDIIVNGGNITATGSTYGAAIGGGCGDDNVTCGNITINGGTIVATGADCSSGIGTGGFGSRCGSITITGGNIKASSSGSGAGIGCGCGSAGSCGTITISGGNIESTGTSGCPGIGSNEYTPDCGDITIRGGYINATGGKYWDHIGAGIATKGASITITTVMLIFVRGNGPTTELANDGSNLYGKLTQRYITIRPDFLNFVGKADGTIKFDKHEYHTGSVTATLEYSSDVNNWTDYTYGTALILNTDEKIYFRAKGTNGKNATFSIDPTYGDYINFVSTADVEANGNVMSLIDASGQTLEVPTNAFSLLFENCNHLLTAPKLTATKLNENSYLWMFAKCSALKKAPTLPATDLAKNCYAYMFRECTSLESAPELTALTVPDWAYQNMFSGCTKLTDLPQLPATTIGEYAYQDMFNGCTGIKVNTLGFGTPWTIPATTNLGSNWNHSMFYNTSGSFTDNPEAGKTYYVDNVNTYTRTTSEGKFGTICLPYTYTVEGAIVYSATLNEAKDNVTLTEVTTPVAGTPYIYEATADTQTFTYTGDAVAEPVAADPLVGVFADTKATADTYVLQTKSTGQAFYHVAEGSEPTVSAYKAYLTVPASSDPAKFITIGFSDDDATAINAINALTSGTAKIYDLSGRQLKTLQKGVNIVNGVKIMVK